MALQCLWRQFYLQQLQRLSCCCSGRITQPPGAPSPLGHHHTQQCKVACDHTIDTLMAQPSERNHQCHVDCLHPKRFIQMREQLILSRRFSSYGNPTFSTGVGRILSSNAAQWGHGVNRSYSSAMQTGVHPTWMGNLLARGFSNGLMADSVAANSLLLNTVRYMPF